MAWLAVCLFQEPALKLCGVSGRLALDSQHHSLWSPLLQPYLGTTAEDSTSLESRPSLQRHLALVGEAARDAPPGRHSPDVGFAIACTDMLRARYDLIASVQLNGEPSLECSTGSPFRTGPSADSEASQHDESVQHSQATQPNTVQQDDSSQQGKSVPGDRELPNGDWDHIDESQLSQPASKANSIRQPSNIMENGVLSEASERLVELLEVSAISSSKVISVLSQCFDRWPLVKAVPSAACRVSCACHGVSLCPEVACMQHCHRGHRGERHQSRLRGPAKASGLDAIQGGLPCPRDVKQQLPAGCLHGLWVGAEGCRADACRLMRRGRTSPCLRARWTISCPWRRESCAGPGRCEACLVIPR